MRKINLFRISIEILIIFLLFQAYTKDVLIGYIGLLMVMSFTWFRVYIANIRKDMWIFILLIVAFMLSIMTNFINVSGINVSDFKVILNGSIWIFLMFYAFMFGKTIRTMPVEINKIMNFIVFIFLINAIVNIYTWFTTTGGVIGRYNFVSPITMNTSAGINLSILGFFLALENIKTKKVTWLLPVIFAFNVLIIVTRKEQLIFSLLLFFYIFLKIRSKKKIINKLFIFWSTTLIVGTVYFVFQKLFISTYSKYYINIFSETGQDMVTRENAKKAALYMFNESPIFGRGYGFFAMDNNSFTELASAHNGALSILAEWGIFGVLISICIGTLILIVSFRAINRYNIQQKYNNIISMFLITAVFMTFIANSAFLPPPNEQIYYLYGLVLWIMFGLVREVSFKKEPSKIKRIQ